MTDLVDAGPATAVAAPAPARRVRPGRIVAVFAGAAVAVVLLALVDLTLGTSRVGVGDLLGLLTGSGDDEALAVLVASRAPRVLAALLVGTALGLSGSALQSVARNPLASPDTLAVNAGAYFTVVLAAVTGLSLPFAVHGGLAFVGGLAASALVLAIARGGAEGPTRLVLAGSATMLALSSLTILLMLLFEQETQGMFAWGEGSIVQSGTAKVTQAAPVVLVAGLLLVLWSRRLDVLALGDDTASVLGLDVRRTRVVTVLLAVLLAAVAVTVAGPIGFVGLTAPVIARLVAGRVPGLARHRLVLPLAALTGCVVVLGADVLLRLAVPGVAGVAIPTGVVTTLFGAAVMVWLARRLRDSGPARRTAAVGAHPASRSKVALVVGVLVASVVAALVAGFLLGDRLLLLGDVTNWFAGRQRSAGQLRAGPAGPARARRPAGRRRAGAGGHHGAGGRAQPAGRAGPAGHHRRCRRRRGPGPRPVPRRQRLGGLGRGVRRRAGHVRAGLRVGAPARAELGPAGARRHRRLGRGHLAHHPARGAHQPVEHDDGAHVAVRLDVRPHGRAGVARGGRAAGAHAPAGALASGPRRRSRSTTTWPGCSACRSSGRGWACSCSRRC